MLKKEVVLKHLNNMILHAGIRANIYEQTNYMRFARSKFALASSCDTRDQAEHARDQRKRGRIRFRHRATGC